MRNPAALFCFSLLVLASAPFACSSQGEGQRCNVDNGNDDCETGLICTSSRDLGGNADICCPASGTSTSPDCSKGGTTSATTSSGGGMGGGTTSSSGGGGMGGMGGGTTSSSGGGGMGGMGGGTTSSSGGGGMSAGGGGAGGN